MSDTIITVEGLGKRYRLGAKSGERYTALRDVLADKAKGLFRRNGKPTADLRSLTSLEANAAEFWALKDVSFEVRRGEVVGIIGRNGAGKSTLLKILSRITEPTEGRIKVRGRVASLLEVGTGFHPELSGRENIYLNGAILGMTKAEIKAKFDEIVSFAEVEKFLDTPVKRYSSGMYVRLAFAVAAHLEPEILIVDEVLAVGDAQFQKKCLGKMQQVAKGDGRTVLFVSHNMGAVTQLCNTALFLAVGRGERFKRVADAVTKYSKNGDQRHSTRSFRHVEAVKVHADDENITENHLIQFGDPLEIAVFLRGLPTQTPAGVNVGIRNEAGVLISLFSTNPHDGIELPRAEAIRINLRLCECFFAPGRFTIDVSVTEPGYRIVEDAPDVASFEVQPRAIGGHWPYDSRFGYVFPKHEWVLRS